MNEPTSFSRLSSREGSDCKYLIAIGAVYLDTILTVPHYPGEDEKLRATSIVRRRGGNCPNTLEVLSQFVHDGEHNPVQENREEKIGTPSTTPPSGLALIAVLPDEESVAYAEIAESLPAVDMSWSTVREDANEAPSSYIIKSEATGSRTIVNFNELAEMTFEDFRSSFDKLTAEYDLVNGLQSENCWCHFEGRIPDVTLECIKFLRASYLGVTISVEIEKPGRKGLQELAEEADVVFYSKSRARSKGYASAGECLKQQATLVHRASYLFCTWGADGAAAFHRSTKECLVLPAYLMEGAQVVDTIGAGDTFIAGILYGFLEHEETWDLERKLAFAIEFAGRKVVQEGFSGLKYHMEPSIAR